LPLGPKIAPCRVAIGREEFDVVRPNSKGHRGGRLTPLFTPLTGAHPPTDDAHRPTDWVSFSSVKRSVQPTPLMEHRDPQVAVKLIF